MNKQRTFYVMTAGFLALLGMVGCGGALSNPNGGDLSTDTREISGNVASSTSSAALETESAVTASGCRADIVTATNTSGETVTATESDDCSFSLILNVGTSYSIGFIRDGVFVGSLVFGASETDALPIVSGTSTIDLGTIDFQGLVAHCRHDPYDDGDLTELSPRVINVWPRNDPRPEHGEDDVEVNREVRARVSCRLDVDSVTSETFRITSSTGDDVACAFSFEEHGEDKDTIICSHEQSFALDTLYTATINGVLCDDGVEVASRSWTWSTAASEDNSEDNDDSGEHQNSDHRGSRDHEHGHDVR